MDGFAPEHLDLPLAFFVAALLGALGALGAETRSFLVLGGISTIRKGTGIESRNR